MEIEKQVVVVYAATKGCSDKLNVSYTTKIEQTSSKN